MTLDLSKYAGFFDVSKIVEAISQPKPHAPRCHMMLPSHLYLDFDWGKDGSRFACNWNCKGCDCAAKPS